MGRWSTWTFALLAAAFSAAGLAVGMFQAGKSAMPTYVPDFDLTVRGLFLFAALAFLASLYCGGKLAVEWLKGKPAVSDQPQQPGPGISGDISVSNTTNTGHIGHVQNIGQQPRTLRGVDVEPIRERLAPYASTAVDISAAGDDESISYVYEIQALLQSAGWDVNLGARNYSSARPGVAVCWLEATPALTTLVDILEGLGRHAIFAQVQAPIDSKPHIIVGAHDRRP